MLRITIGGDLSLNDLTKEIENGGSVMRTPHVGNVYLSNLVILALGIPVICHDRTNGMKDLLYHPHGVIGSGQFDELADSELLTTHARVKNPVGSGDHQRYFQMGTRMVEGHMRSLRDAFPQDGIAVWGDVLAELADLMLAVLDRLHAAHPDALAMWYRIVDADGIIHRREPKSWDQVRGNIFRISSEQGGWILPNTLNVLLSAILQHRQAAGRDRVYHLSGPDMIRYIGEMTPKLERYARSLEPFFDGNACEFTVVPVAHIRFATLERNASAIEELWDRVQALASYNDGIDRVFAQLEGRPSKEAIGEAISERQHRTGAIVSATRACPEIFRSPAERCALTQYDLLASGGRIHVPEGVKAVPTGKLLKLWGATERLARAAA